MQQWMCSHLSAEKINVFFLFARCTCKNIVQNCGDQKKTLAIKQFCIPLYLCFCCQFRNNWPSAGISTRLHFYSDNIWNNNFQFCLIVTHSLSFMFSSMTNKWHVTGSSISKYIFSFKWHMDLVFCQAWT